MSTKQKLTEKELIAEIQDICFDVKCNLQCCYTLLEYLDPKRDDENWKVLSMIYSHIDYLYYLLRNHLQISILSLSSLLCPYGDFKTKEISPYNRIITLKEKEKKELIRISKEFSQKQLRNFRHTSIAHKVKTEDIEKIKYGFRRGDKQILKNMSIVHEKFEKWLVETFGEFDWLLEDDNDHFKGLEKIIKYINTGLSAEQDEFMKNVWPYFIKKQ